MNFKEWFKIKDKSKTVDENARIYDSRLFSERFSEDDLADAWTACKEEILKILEKHTQFIIDTELQREDPEKFINLECIKEIQKL